MCIRDRAITMSGGLLGGTVESRGVSLSNNRGAKMLEDAGPDIDWDDLTFSFTETDRSYKATC